MRSANPQADISRFCVKDVSSFSPKERAAIMQRVGRIEKKTFPASEIFNFDAELKKKNTRMIVAIDASEEGAAQPIPKILGYLVYLRMKRLTLLHKICVVEQERGRGVGKCLIHSLRLLVRKGGCDSIDLWVDEARNPARALYESFGFQQIDRVGHYYGPERTGLKMQLSIKNDDS